VKKWNSVFSDKFWVNTGVAVQKVRKWNIKLPDKLSW
jgi:hypothetical protein